MNRTCGVFMKKGAIAIYKVESVVSFIQLVILILASTSVIYSKLNIDGHQAKTLQSMKLTLSIFCKENK
jgi:hypothetical protein